MSELRLVLLCIGALVIVGVLGWTVLRCSGSDAGSSSAVLRALDTLITRITRFKSLFRGTEKREGTRSYAEPTLGNVSDEIDSDAAAPIDVGDLSVLAEASEAVPVRGPRNGDGGTHPPASPGVPGESDKLLMVLTVMAPADARFKGERLEAAFVGFDLEHGRMGLFHHFAGRQANDARPVFSVANVMEPGTFDVAGWRGFETEGLCLFMQVPGPIDGPIAFDLMVDIGAKLARELGGELRDSHRSSLTGQGIAQMREQVVEHTALAGRRVAPANPQRTLH